MLESFITKRLLLNGKTRHGKLLALTYDYGTLKRNIPSEVYLLKISNEKF